MSVQQQPQNSTLTKSNPTIKPPTLTNTKTDKNGTEKSPTETKSPIEKEAAEAQLESPEKAPQEDEA